jgi:uncharacterized protein (TIGR02118 family)
MPARVLALYNHPADTAAFDAHYTQTHIPTAKKIPGLRSYAVSSGPVGGGDGSPSPYHLVAELGFDSAAAIQQALQTPEGAATVADLGNFAQAGVTILIYETKDV